MIVVDSANAAKLGMTLDEALQLVRAAHPDALLVGVHLLDEASEALREARAPAVTQATPATEASAAEIRSAAPRPEHMGHTFAAVKQLARRLHADLIADDGGYILASVAGTQRFNTLAAVVDRLEDF